MELQSRVKETWAPPPPQLLSVRNDEAAYVETLLEQIEWLEGTIYRASKLPIGI